MMPLSYSTQQDAAMQQMRSFLSNTPSHLKAFDDMYDTPFVTRPIADFWQLTQHLPQFPSIVVPAQTIQNRAIYNIRTSEIEQNGQLQYIAYVTQDDHKICLGIAKKHNVEFVSSFIGVPRFPVNSYSAGVSGRTLSVFRLCKEMAAICTTCQWIGHD
jgi:hypothetical protein